MQGIAAGGMGMPAQPGAGSPYGGPAGANIITTELIQKYLDENKQLILAILDNQNLGKLNECAQSEKDGVIYVPRSYHPDRPSPVILALHGDESSAEEALRALQPFAEQHRLLLAAPDAREENWDVRPTAYNEDVDFIDRALDLVFENYTVQDDKIALAGFSDGASVALDLGVRNGPIFSHVMAFNPTASDPPCYEDGPEIFLTYQTNGEGGSHINGCRTTVAPRLRSCGYKCQIHEFKSPLKPIKSQSVAGSRTLSLNYLFPKEVVKSAVDWFTGSPCRDHTPFEYDVKVVLKGSSALRGLRGSKAMQSSKF